MRIKDIIYTCQRPGCGNTFQRPDQSGPCKYCSKFCKDNRNGLPEERFWSHVRKTDTCWIWEAARKKGGYGQIRIDGKVWGAHVFSWTIHNGPVPEWLDELRSAGMSYSHIMTTLNLNVTRRAMICVLKGLTWRHVH